MNTFASESRRSTFAVALLLIGLGAWFFTVEMVPAVKDFAYGEGTWPIPILAIAAGIALIGIVTWTPGMMIPASIVGGIGALLFYQNTTKDWDSWAYAWSLIPGFVGIGIILTGAMSRHLRGPLTAGGILLLISLVLYGVFGSFLGGGALANLIWPAVLIGLGVIVLLRSILPRAR